eukprot:366055-Chlamydomonas_euryale.AAC.18
MGWGRGWGDGVGWWSERGEGGVELGCTLLRVGVLLRPEEAGSISVCHALGTIGYLAFPCEGWSKAPLEDARRAAKPRCGVPWPTVVVEVALIEDDLVEEQDRVALHQHPAVDLLACLLPLRCGAAARWRQQCARERRGERPVVLQLYRVLRLDLVRARAAPRACAADLPGGAGKVCVCVTACGRGRE